MSQGKPRKPPARRCQAIDSGRCTKRGIHEWWLTAPQDLPAEFVLVWLCDEHAGGGKGGE